MSDETREKTTVRGQDLFQKVKDLIHEGNVRKIILRDEKDKLLLELPLTVGLVGIAIAPLWAVLGAVGAVAFNYKIEIIRKEEPVAKPASEKKPAE
jgi:hypothetical protein